MKFNLLLENIVSESYDNHVKSIQKAAAMYRKMIDDKKREEQKAEEKADKQSKKLYERDTKKSIGLTIRNFRAACKNQESLLYIIEDCKDQLDPEIYDFIKSVATQVSHLKTKNKKGTLLITRNAGIVPKIIDNRIVQKSMNPEIKQKVSRILTTINANINSKISGTFLTDFRKINNNLFSLFRDLLLELIRENLMKRKGISWQ